MLREAEAAARTQAALLNTILDSTGDGVGVGVGVGVVNSVGELLLHNRAAKALLSVDDDQPDPGTWQWHYGMFLEDGILFPVERMPMVRAMNEESTDAVGMVSRHAGRPDGVIVTVTRWPLDSSARLAGGAVAVFHDVTQARSLQLQVVVQHEVQRQLLDILSDLGAALLITRQGRLVQVNQAYAELIGGEVRELIGSQAESVAADEDAIEDLRQLGGAVEPGGRVGPVSTRLRHRDGHVVFVEVTGTAVEHPDGLQRVLLLRDVTERFRTQQELNRRSDLLQSQRLAELEHREALAQALADAAREREACTTELARSQAAFQAAFDDALVGMNLATPTGRLLRVNAVFAGMLGYTTAQMVDLTMADITHPDDLRTTLDGIARCLAGEANSFQQTKRLLRADGAVVHAEVSASLHRDDTGQPVQFTAQVIDTSDRVLAEHERDVHQAMLRAVMDNSQSLIYVKDLDGRYLLVNAPLQQAFGRPEAEIVGRSDQELLGWDDPSWRERDRRARYNQERDEDTVTRADGLVVIYDSVRFPLHDVTGRLYGTCGISLNVTASRQATAQKEAAAHLITKAAVEASEVKSQFLSTMSHEIRTPLNGVLGLLTLLMGTDLDARQQSWTVAAERSGRALLSIVNDVLDAAKIEAGAVELESIEFELLTVVDDALLPLRQEADDKGLSLIVAPTRGVDRHRIGDPTRVRQVITNLVANAVKFTEQGTVTVLVAGSRLQVTLSVSDTGIGMTAQQREHLFTPFVQAQASTTRRFGGTGLGLSIVHGLVEQMGGHITVVSSPGTGSSFQVSLPLTAVESPRSALSAPASAVVTATPLHSGLRLLVAEDNAVNQLVARATLEKHGMHVDIVSNGAEAVAAVANGQYDAVFMDCHMPHTNGLEAARRIRAAEQATGSPRLLIVAMTASAFDEDRAACHGAGMDGFLPKPWTTEQLTQILAGINPP